MRLKYPLLGRSLLHRHEDRHYREFLPQFDETDADDLPGDVNNETWGLCTKAVALHLLQKDYVQ